MKRVLRTIVVLLFAALAPLGYADSVPTFNVGQAVFYLFPNEAGGNDFFYFNGVGISISGSGTALCNWCLFGQLLPAGSSLTPGIPIALFDSIQGFVNIGENSYDLSGGVLYDSSITALGSFTFPMNSTGSFTITVPAVLNGPIQGFAPSLPPPGSFNLQIPHTGALTLTFDFAPAHNGYPASYFFSSGQFSTVPPLPEPGMLVMMGTGLCGIAGIVRRRWKEFAKGVRS
jgi:hypothetical protein